MMTLQDILDVKGSQVYTISPTATVREATQKMNRHKVGCLVVMVEDQVVGIFTERDVLRRVVVSEQRPDQMLVEEVMTADVFCCGPDAELNEVAAIMKNKRIRHVPVCDADSRLMGVVSMGDVNARHASQQQAEIHYLQEYIYGRV